MLETPNVIKTGNNTYTTEFGSDKNLYVRFFEDAVKNQFRSDEEGIESFDQFIFVEVITAGNKTVYLDKIAVYKPEHTSSDGSLVKGQWIEFGANNGIPTWQKRFPQQWAQFKASQEQTVEGYPVTECPFFQKAYALNLKSQHIHTLEQIRDLPDTSLGILGLGAREIRNKVTAFLNKAGDASQITKLFAKIEQLEADNLAMKEMLTTKVEDSTPSPKAKHKAA